MSQSQAIQALDTKDRTEILRKIITTGDLSDLTPEQQVDYLFELCSRVNLDPLTMPFNLLEIADKETGRKKVVPYANKNCVPQLKKNHGVSVWKIETKIEDGCCIATAYARTPDGREDIDEGVVWVKGLASQNLSNARMKAVTKAKRRVTLSICGLGFIDESEIDSIPNARSLPSPEQDAVMTNQESEQLTLTHKALGLDQWTCNRGLAMKLITVCKLLEAEGADSSIWHAWLPSGIESRKDLSEEQARETFDNFTGRLEIIKKAEISKWNCSPSLAVKLLEVYGELITRGVDRATISQRLPDGMSSFRALSDAQAEEALKALTHWLKTYNEVVEGKETQDDSTHSRPLG